MRTPLQIEASRANGSQSRGPVTAPGKLASSRNAVKHGLLSSQVVLKTEKDQIFLDLIAALYDEFQPATPFEESLVDSMAVARWRQQRLWNIERETMESQIYAEHEKNPAAALHPAILTSRAFGSLASGTRTLDLMNRYESRFDRQYLRAHRRLLEVQDRRQKSGPTPEPALQLVPPMPAPGVSAGNLTPVSAKRTQPAARPFVRIRYRRRDKNRPQPRPDLKSPLPGDNLAKNS